MITGPSLSSHQVTVYRRETGVDVEGSLSNTWEIVGDFYGGFGVPRASRQEVAGAPGQRVDAAISTKAKPDVQVGDKLRVNGRDWAVLGIYDTGITRRIQLAIWGGK